jgi:hypothetical protein
MPDQTTPVQDRFQFYTRLPDGDFVPLQFRGSIEWREDGSATVTLEDQDAMSEIPAEVFLHDRENPGVYHRRSFRHVGQEEPDEHTESESDSEESEEPHEDDT